MNRFEGLEAPPEPKRNRTRIERIFTEEHRSLVRDLLGDDSRRAQLIGPPKHRFDFRKYPQAVLQSAEAYLEGRDTSEEAKHAFAQILLEAELQAREANRRELGEDTSGDLSSSLSPGPRTSGGRSTGYPSLDDYDKRWYRPGQ
jgi:hypothetical protein